ncbi:uncharacterized protein [Antedon mediterranea]|uniref:uncharacterized protein n=1 Tax=Antedon mediterranea TaxID=105859 RepID=UPI003AF72EB6
MCETKLRMTMKIFSCAVVFVCCMIALSEADVRKSKDIDTVGQYIWNIITGGYRGNGPCRGLKEEFLKLMNNISTVYTRWGRNTCPESADLVYSGYIGGGLYSHKGAGTNPQCMPRVPEYNAALQSTGGSRGYIYGAEYETASYVSAFSTRNNGDAVCAVCRARGKSATLTIPAKQNCPEDWTKEYEGLMMGSNSGHYGINYLCVDENPEMIPGSTANKDGLLLYPVVSTCGSLPCAPYTANNELSCVVCTA